MIVWMLKWSDKDCRDIGFCHYQTVEQVVRHAIVVINGRVDWNNFPDPARHDYPFHDDRDGSEGCEPAFRAGWDTGWAEIYRIHVSDKFRPASEDGIDQRIVEAILKGQKKRETPGS